MSFTNPSRVLAVSAVALALSCGATSAGAQEAVPQNDLLNATLWMQNSVEYKATVEGLFALAQLRLGQALANTAWTAVPDKQGQDFSGKPVAIITDLDETVLDNNVYEASLILRGTGFSSSEWTDYVNDEVTKAVPGAIEFLNYAASQGVAIFYVSNRTKEEEPATARNMEALGFPMGDNVDTILSKGEQEGWGSAKENRIQVVADDYRVVLLMGDNFGDFTDVAKGTPEERAAFLEASAEHWGHDWIMFPNPEYGSWESTLFGNDYSKSEDQRRQEKIDTLDAWSPAN